MAELVLEMADVWVCTVCRRALWSSWNFACNCDGDQAVLVKKMRWKTWPRG